LGDYFLNFTTAQVWLLNLLSAMKSENLKADNSAVGLQCKITVKK